MKGKISFNDLPQALEAIIQTQELILNAIQQKGQQQKILDKELLTVDEAANLLDINRTTLWRWEKEGKIKSYGISSRRYFKLSEIENALIPLN